MRLLRRYCRDEEGASAIEYGVFATVLAIVLVAMLGPGGVMDGTYKKLGAINRALDGSAPSGEAEAEGRVQALTDTADRNRKPTAQAAN
jgi:Flp pilus assembly pilin Flp